MLEQLDVLKQTPKKSSLSQHLRGAKETVSSSINFIWFTHDTSLSVRQHRPALNFKCMQIDNRTYGNWQKSIHAYFKSVYLSVIEILYFITLNCIVLYMTFDTKRFVKYTINVLTYYIQLFLYQATNFIFLCYLLHSQISSRS